MKKVNDRGKRKEREGMLEQLRKDAAQSDPHPAWLSKIWLSNITSLLLGWLDIGAWAGMLRELHP